MPPVQSRALGRAASLLTRSLLFALIVSSAVSSARAQAIGAHHSDTANTGGNSSIEGHIISPTGKLPDTRIRVTLDSTNTGAHVTAANEDGSFNFSGLERGSYTLIVDAGKEFEIARESIFIDAGKPMSNVPIYL